MLHKTTPSVTPLGAPSSRGPPPMSAPSSMASLPMMPQVGGGAPLPVPPPGPGFNPPFSGGNRPPMDHGGPKGFPEDDRGPPPDRRDPRNRDRGPGPAMGSRNSEPRGPMRGPPPENRGPPLGGGPQRPPLGGPPGG